MSLRPANAQQVPFLTIYLIITQEERHKGEKIETVNDKLQMSPGMKGKSGKVRHVV